LLPYFQNYSWPGNVRELENAVARMVLLARGDTITLADLPAFLNPAAQSPAVRKPPASEEFIGLKAMERAAIVSALQKFGGNQSSAARYLKISRKVLINRIAKFHILKSEARAAGN
jgi:DNA-binding NtrC family response regulator